MPGRQQERIDTELTLKLENGCGLLRNVSASGVYFVTDVALTEGQPVRFMLEFADFPSGPISVSCVARVVRVEELGAKRGVAAAISSFEFQRIADADRCSGNEED